MSYSQDTVPRTCGICTKAIQQYEEMLDLFREHPEQSKVVWVHETCAKLLLQNWWLRKQKS